jgi:hypothetical protein
LNLRINSNKTEFPLAIKFSSGSGRITGNSDLYDPNSRNGTGWLFERRWRVTADWDTEVNFLAKHAIGTEMSAIVQLLSRFGPQLLPKGLALDELNLGHPIAPECPVIGSYRHQ